MPALNAGSASPCARQWRLLAMRIFRRRCACGECSVGEAWTLGHERKLRTVCITNFEDLMEELAKLKKQGVPAFIGCCCQPFYIKHAEDFDRQGLPGILIDIENTTCYELDQSEAAYKGQFRSQTSLNMPLLHSILRVAQQAHAPGGEATSCHQAHRFLPAFRPLHQRPHTLPFFRPLLRSFPLQPPFCYSQKPQPLVQAP